jgi:hypothetical protein
VILGEVLPLNVAPERVGVEHVAHDGVSDRLGVEPQEVLSAQDAEVRAQLPLVVEDRGVAAGAGPESVDVVADLALQEVDRLTAAHDELGALGAVHQPGGLREELVLAGGDHASIVLAPAPSLAVHDAPFSPHEAVHFAPPWS